MHYIFFRDRFLKMYFRLNVNYTGLYTVIHFANMTYISSGAAENRDMERKHKPTDVMNPPREIIN